MNRSGLEKVSDALSQGECLLLVLSRPRQNTDGGVTKVSIHPLVIRDQPVYQFAFHEAERVRHENLPRRRAGERAADLLSESFDDAALYTSEANYSLRRRADGSFACKEGPPTRSAAAPRAHTRAKEYLIPEGVPCPFLAEIGVMTAEGRVRRSMMHKFRQINRFLELVNNVVPSLETGRELRIVDFGCGKSYLTFALHHLLTGIHRRPVRIIGLDRKAEVIRHCAEIAGRLSCRGLEFREGDIATHQESEPVDLAVSLHACDTATDDALAQAVRWQSRVILAVPCCQHELAQRIASHELAPLLGQGILRERFAALATDTLRALVLEIAGYSTQVVEFIDLEHTAKNVLIRAVRRDRADPPLRETRLAEYRALTQALGIADDAEFSFSKPLRCAHLAPAR